MRAYACLPNRLRIEPAVVAGRRDQADAGAGRARGRDGQGANSVASDGGGPARRADRRLATLVCAAAHLRALFPATGRQADGLRRVRAADVRRTLPHAARRSSRRFSAYALACASPLLARPGALRHGRHLSVLFFFYKIRIVPGQFWMARRFLPVILPGALTLRIRERRSRGPRVVLRARAVIRGSSRSRVHSLLLALRCCEWLRRFRTTSNARESSPRSNSWPARHPGHRPPDRGIAGCVGHSRARRCRWLTSTTRNVLLLRSRVPDKVSIRIVPGLGPPAIRPRAVHGRRRHRAALATMGCPAQLPASDSGCRSSKPARYTFPRTVRRKEFDYSLYEFVPPSARQRPRS